MNFSDSLARHKPATVRSLRNAVYVLSIVFWAIVVYYAVTRELGRIYYSVVFLAFMMIVYVITELRETIEEGRRRETGFLVIAGLITVGSVGYLLANFEVLLTQRVGVALPYEVWIAAAFILTIIYLSYRSYGLTFGVVVLIGIGYGLFGDFVPGLLGHGGISPNRLATIMVLDFRGVFGSINQIMATWVALFLLYAGLIRGYGAFDLILQAAFRAAAYLRSGVAQSAVLSSLIIGSITGASTANVAITGSITIPTMKKSGLKPETAAGIEAVASSGGQIMPPVMAATAFVMASFLGRSYAEIMIAGIIPAAVFYVSAVSAVHFTSVRQLDASAELDVDSFVGDTLDRREFFSETIKFLIPFLLLVYLLGIAKWTVMTSALYTCALMMVTGIGFPLARSVLSGGEDLRETVREVAVDTVESFRYGAVTLGPIAIIIAAVNGVLDILTATGVPGILSLSLLQLTGGTLLLTVLVSMVICIILGLGMPTVAAYIVVAALIAPALTSAPFMIPELAAHYFVFYAAVLSGLTPPIAIAVIVASGIAEASFWKSAREALSVAAPLFVLPIVFIYNPEIITGGFTPATLMSAALVLVGSFGIVFGLNGIAAYRRATPVAFGAKVLLPVLGVLTMVLPTSSYLLPRFVTAAAILGLFAVFSLDWFDVVRDGAMDTSAGSERNA